MMVTFSDFSQTIQRRAIENINRKLQGQRITNFVEGKFSSELVDAQRVFRRENPDVARSIERAGLAQTASERLGFTSIREAAGAQQQFSPRGIQVQPTQSFPVPVQSFPTRLQTEPIQQFERGRQVQPKSAFEIASAFPVAPGFGEQTRFPTGPVDVGREIRGFGGQIIQASIPTRFLEPSQETFVPTTLPIQREQVLQPTVPEIREIEQRPSARDVLFGEVGRPFVGFDILPRVTPAFFPRQRDVSLTQIQTVLRAAPTDISLPRIPGTGGVTDFLPRPSEFAGFGIRTGAELIPTTPGEIGITGGLIAASVFAPPIIGTGIGFGVAGLGIRTVLDPGLTLEQRAAGGLVGVLGGVGAAAGVTPFVRGIGARGVRTAPEGFEVLPGLKGVGDIGLIQPGAGARVPIDLPPTSPLVRGGFGVRPGEKAQFLGPEQLLATSQRGLFEVGRDIPIQREFFVTPQEPILGIAETRISRLGLQDPFRIPESVEIGFGLPGRPQIGITRGRVARREAADAFAIGTGTELEAIRTTGLITDVTQIGRARIRGQGVDIFEFEIGRVPRVRTRPLREVEDFFSIEGTSRISGETLLGTLGRIPTRGITIRTSALISPLITAPTSPDISIPVSPPVSLPISPPLGPGISPLPSDLISPGLIPTVSPPTIPSIAPEIFPLFEDPLRRIRIPRRGKKKEKKVKKGKRRLTPIRPSFTGIVLGIEEAAEVTPGLGILPGQIRGLATGFDVPTRRKKAKAKKKVTKKKSVKKKRKKS